MHFNLRYLQRCRPRGTAAHRGRFGASSSAGGPTRQPPAADPLRQRRPHRHAAERAQVFHPPEARPEKRVSLRLAVKAGSLFEADDQQGLAHLIEHMAFNGSTHFKPGELVSYFESTGARLGPHVNAYTSFDETVYMLDLPTDSQEVVTKGLTALADFAGGLTLDQTEVDKERGVVIEEWRGRPRRRLAHPRQADPGPVSTTRDTRNACRSASRTSSATRRPRACARSTTPGIARSAWRSSPSATSSPQALETAIRDAFGPLKARAAAVAPPDGSVPLYRETLRQRHVTDPEVTSSSVQFLRKRPAESEQLVGDYRREPRRKPVHADVQRSLRRARAQTGREVSERGRRRRFARPDGRHLRSERARGRTAALPAGSTALEIEARRVQQFGFTASELDARSGGCARSTSARSTSATRTRAARTRRSI